MGGKNEQFSSNGLMKQFMVSLVKTNGLLYLTADSQRSLLANDVLYALFDKCFWGNHWRSRLLNVYAKESCRKYLSCGFSYCFWCRLQDGFHLPKVCQTVWRIYNLYQQRACQRGLLLSGIWRPHHGHPHCPVLHKKIRPHLGRLWLQQFLFSTRIAVIRDFGSINFNRHSNQW